MSKMNTVYSQAHHKLSAGSAAAVSRLWPLYVSLRLHFCKGFERGVVVFNVAFLLYERLDTTQRQCQMIPCIMRRRHVVVVARG